jgi:subfamily B ATP-binding cassette protein MsbA
MGNQIEKGKTLTIGDLLKPHSKALAVGLLAVIGEGIVNILEPWPLKIILDNVLQSRSTQAGSISSFYRRSVTTSSRSSSMPRSRYS